MINVNDIFASAVEKQECRVLWISADDNTAFIIYLSDNSLPIQTKLAEIERQLQDGSLYLTNEDKYNKISPEKLLAQKDKNFRDKTWTLIKPLVYNEPEIYDGAMRGKLIRKAVLETGITQMTYYKYLKKYWKGGKNKNTLLPNYSNCGRGVRRKDYIGAKIGRPRKYTDVVGTNVNQETKEIFAKAVKQFYHTQQGLPLTVAYDLMIKEYFTEKTQLPTGEIKLQLKEANQIPSMGQFRYWYSKTYSINETISSRKGQSKFDRDHRAILGKSDTNVIGPGSQYQIDATVGDIYLVSRFNRANIIGRPVIYFVIDVFSRLITGIYVGLEGPSWIGSMMALANAASDKIAFCESYGIDISEEQWPSHHIPDVILADRGEMESKSVETLINALNVRVDNAPPYRADMKGIVEQLFKTVNMKTTIFLPGHVKPDMSQRGGKDYRLDAKLDIFQFTKIIIQYVLNHNNEHLLESYERSSDMIESDVIPIPKNLWEFGITHRSGRLRSVSENTIKICLMPSASGLVTAKGIRFKGIIYLNERAIAEHWFETARAKGSYKINISYDPRNMSNVYIQCSEKTAFESCFLADWESKYNGKCLEEIQHQQALEKEMRSHNEKRELQSRIDLDVEIEKIVAEAEEMAKQTAIPNSKHERTAHIRENRNLEKQINRVTEAFTVDDGKEETEVQTNEIADEQISPTLAMIKKKLEERLNGE